MSERAPYSRVYWSIQHDEKFDGIREDMRLIGSWLTLLVCADQSWPAPAYPPPIVGKAAIQRLAEAGLVDVLSGGRYRVHGLDAERGRRAEAGRIGGIASGTVRQRTVNGRSPSSRTESNLDETRRDEQRRDETREPIDRILDVWLSVKYHLPTDRQRAFLHAYLQTFDETGEARAARAILANPHDPIAAMKTELAEFRKERVAALEEEVAKPVVRRKAGLPQSARELLEHWQATAPEEVA